MNKTMIINTNKDPPGFITSQREVRVDVTEETSVPVGELDIEAPTIADNENVTETKVSSKENGQTLSSDDTSESDGGQFAGIGQSDVSQETSVSEFSDLEAQTIPPLPSNIPTVPSAKAGRDSEAEPNKDDGNSMERATPLVDAKPVQSRPVEPSPPRIRAEIYPRPHPIEPQYAPPSPPPLHTQDEQHQDQEQQQDKEQQQPLVKRYWKWATVSLVLLVLILAVVLGVVLGRGGTKDASESTQSPHPDTFAPHVSDTPTDPPTPAPTTPPTPAPTTPTTPAPTDPPATVLDELVALFSNTSPATATALQDKTSNQYQAMEWLEKDVEENGFDMSTDEDRILARGALAILFYSTNGDGWNNSTGWLDHGVSECDWYGVTCSSTTVTELHLGYYTVWNVSSNNLVGILPPEISLLLALQVFLTGNNTMTGTIATELGSLTNLRELYLWGNQFTGTLPSEFGLLTNLEGLSVDSNSLSGTVPTELGELKKLEWLWLENNEFTGQVPSQVCAIDSLTWLYADCGGSPPEIECTCCTMCCPGGDYC